MPPASGITIFSSRTRSPSTRSILSTTRIWALHLHAALCLLRRDLFLVVLIIAFLVTTGFHFLNGGIRTTKSPARLAAVKAHLSVIGAAIASVRRPDISSPSGNLSTRPRLRAGATYTDIHARMPALTILFWLSLAAAGSFFTMCVPRLVVAGVAVGLWAFVALVIGVLYPTFLQALKVSPNQESLEQPYIQRNIDATRAAFGSMT